ncbi:hypothetical protein [Micromonospora craniellae]|uniref:Uncharacterized protein n=1 Tax=Micromonospora craniellae TaxID=2294034 RepID=A0A372FWT2_9ACTN|nr:hypothetical protein [Micromonospora craniellae]QOC90049.1 hypothetical protein ID554_17740 [Micromonospora craniellae]RFS45251.1 hypothetical protein D0Q02_17660 [Micromonospora craniellae]
MRGGLDETLARMRRREEALRRRSTDPSADDQPDPGPDAPSGVAVTSRPDSRNAGPGWAGTPERVPGAPPRHVTEEVAEALRAVVAAHPGSSVTARIDHAGTAYDLRVTWDGQEVTVSGERAAPPPAWPMPISAVPGWSETPDRPEPDPAARLAELIRRDPSLLTGEDPPG